MDRKALVTIAIPIYNAVTYLNECLKSVISQSYSNIEIILVNDGSTDKSLEICKKWKDRDKRIHIINKKNEGVGLARNDAIHAARGEYIAFIDADDVINEYYIEVLIKLCKDYHADISYCGMVEFFNTLDKDLVCTRPNLSEYNIDCNDNISALKNMFSLWIGPNVCGKLIRKSLFENIKFSGGQRGEDLDVTYRLIYESHYIAGVKMLTLYYYRKGHVSAMSAISSESLVDFEYRLKMYKFMKSIDCQITAQKVSKQTMRFLFDMLCVNKKVIQDYDKFQDRIRNISKVLADEMFYADKTQVYTEKMLLKTYPYLWKYYKIIQRKIMKRLGRETLY